MGDLLVESFGYLVEGARRFGPDWLHWSEPAVLERDASAWRTLAQAHGEIHRREDLPAICAWLHQTALVEDGDHQERREDETLREQTANLLRLLRALGNAGVKPFDAPVIRMLPRPETALLYRQTPPRFRYLLRHARRLRAAPNRARLQRLTATVTPHCFNRLARLADRIRRRGDREAVADWLAASDPHANRSAGMIAGMMQMMEELDIF